MLNVQKGWCDVRENISVANERKLESSQRDLVRLLDGWHKDYILEPLSLPENPGGISTVEGPPSVPCLFCEEYSPISEQNQLLKHMIIEHKLVIADVKLVADFRRYAQYWKKRFAEQPVTDFCCVIRTNSEALPEVQDNYFLLCDALPEDRALREKLQQQRLREILEQQQQERYDANFHGTCMFCDKEFAGNRSLLLNHMANDHAFNIGLPDNIVNCKEFLDLIQKKLDSLQCLYCEKIFRDKNTLKDHMRKKQHRRINAKNREYDRFYIINYLEIHGFDLLKIKSEHGLNFYQQVKIVNFIRREVHQCQCYICQEKFPSKKDLVNHMEETKHITSLPAQSMWDQPQYYFPTYENDTLLCTLLDSEDELSSVKPREDVPVISEDISNIEALKQSSVLNQLLCEEINNEGP
ncbi:hypothetical protein JD844_027828 [Phrynosoma platyrhinos]|uniref:C2H2-type domain-containing protein n=1 Tax=Phrynosoma platyrhinos TaxID=52577 RepID=A0ABQ7SH54_PHRPL|nr:hypothetical protein JD844_027828 [Phrynosoma platyrhinos]